MWKSLTVVAATLTFGALPGRPDASPAAPDAAAASIAATPRAQEMVIDGGHSSTVFRVMHLSASPFWGRFNEISGSLKVDDDNLDESFIKVEVPTGSVDTADDNRDKHLRSQDFFAAKEFPNLTFESSKIEKIGDDRYSVTGTIELRGTSKEITFEAVHTGTSEINERFGLRSGYEADFEIDRTEFGISYGSKGGVLGKTVRIIIAIEAKLP